MTFLNLTGETEMKLFPSLEEAKNGNSSSLLLKLNVAGNFKHLHQISYLEGEGEEAKTKFLVAHKRVNSELAAR